MNHIRTRVLWPLLGLAVAGVGTAIEPATNPAPHAAPAVAAPAQNDQDKALYALGVMLSRGLDTFQLSEAEFSKVSAGMADGYRHKTSAVGVDAYMLQVQALQ
ncbi:MAG TPA: hypothetical protein VII41_10040, partial [Steroidobacteraceae bacterium]